MSRLTHRARTILWAGCGAFVGLALGVAFVDPDFLVVMLIPWTILLLVFVGAVAALGRPKAERPRDVVVRPQAAAPPAPLQVAIFFPDIPPGLPPVLGVEDPLHVHVTVDRRGGPDVHGASPRQEADVAAEGAAVRLTGKLRDGARFVAGEGVAGTDGSVTFEVKPPGVGEVILEAEAVLGDVRGAGTASVSLVRYEEEIERLFAEFRAYAHDALGPESRSDTARELAEKLRATSGEQLRKPLFELARVYELVVYGERKADRALYLALVGALLQLEKEA